MDMMGFFLKGKVYAHKDDRALRFLCRGSSLSDVWLAIGAGDGWEDLTPMPIALAASYLMQEEF